MPKSYVKRILDARVYDVAIESPVDEAPLISGRLDNRVLLKREDLQPIFSFKLRGAYNKIARLSEKARRRGVIAASAGNHAQGVALASQRLDINATIVMPRTTPDIKVEAVRARGARVILCGDAFEEAAKHARGLASSKGLTFVHPYDDADVIAGQGTVGMEILRQVTGTLDAVFVPVGGGGLLAGIVSYIKYVRPEVKVFAVEPVDAACLQLALQRGRRAVLPHVGLFADGVAVAQIGKETFRIIRDAVDGVITADTDEMCAAIKDIFEDTRSIAEPAGALALAGLKKYVESTQCRGRTLLAVDSGANTNFDRLRYISERTETGEKREAVISVVIPEAPGSFRRFCEDIGRRRSVTEFNYRYADSSLAQIFVGVQVAPHNGDRETLLAELRQRGYEVDDLTDNEAAKLHVRYMVGGHAPGILGDEVVYRFEFPERPGALINFLTQLGHRWNISMFHYRNHGSAIARVLVGFQIGVRQRGQVKMFFRELAKKHKIYDYWDETDNPAYRDFLG